MTTLVADGELREVEPGAEGLLLAGEQVTLGYWLDPEKTAAAFVVPPGKTETHYRPATSFAVHSAMGRSSMSAASTSW
jgi:non-ribosomal peptide synthetase component F